MQQNSQKKICIIVDCLSGGGAEKQAANISIALFNHGFKVSIISLNDKITYDYQGTLHNLGINAPRWKLHKQMKKFFDFKKVYKTINADVYIDFRTRARSYIEFVFHAFIFNTDKMIMTVHSNHINWHLPKGKIFNAYYKKTKAITAVSKKIKEQLLAIYPFQNTVYLPNFVSSLPSKKIGDKPVKDQEYIIAVGRLNNSIKQFDKLILSYKNTNIASRNVQLLIFGDGKDRVFLEELIKKEALEKHVKLMGFSDELPQYICHAKYLVLPSKIEGFPMVLLEALQQETPVIAFDCDSGPSEIIQHQINGLLIEDQNFEAFENAMLEYIENNELYMKCKQNAVSSIAQFTENKIIHQWIQLINA